MSDFPALLSSLDRHAKDADVFQLTATTARMNLPVFSQAAEQIVGHLALCEERIHAAALPSKTSLTSSTAKENNQEQQRIAVCDVGRLRPSPSDLTNPKSRHASVSESSVCCHGECLEH